MAQALSIGGVYSQAAGLAGALVASALGGFGPAAAGIPVEITPPRERERGLLCTPVAFSLAKRLGANPQDVARRIALGCTGALEGIAPSDRLFSSVQAAAGYVNFQASPRYHCRAVEEGAALAEDFGSGSSLAGRKFIVEFSQPNVGKPFHIGHIRSTILGDSVSRLLASQGASVVRFNYIGDSGTQVAKLVLALKVFHDMPEAVDEKGLLDYYTRIHKEIEANPALAQEARDILSKIEEADPATLQEVERIRQLSMEAFNRNYKLLSVDFDEVVGESAFIGESLKKVQECLDRGIASREPDGSVVANLEPSGLPNTILLRSNGTTLYLTRDLALADYKAEKYGFSDSVIFTASEQNTHFRQLQAILKMLGRAYASKYGHVGFGLVFLQSGRLSTREGRVVFLEDVLNESVAAAKAELDSRKSGYPMEEIGRVSSIVGVGGPSSLSCACQANAASPSTPSNARALKATPGPTSSIRA